MWMLLFIIFSQPYTVDHVEILGYYGSRDKCANKVKEVLKNQPLRTTLSCVPLNAKNVRKTISNSR